MILLIDTAQETATVALSENGRIVFSEENPVTNESAAWLHPAVARILGQAGLTIRDLEAVAVIAGPGSYTGLRVGMAAAKGFCYALKIPLITRNTLEVMAASMMTVAKENLALICPMIDARREEVYTALYHPEGEVIQSPRAMILDKSSFELELRTNRIIFFGSGAKKWEKINQHSFALFLPQPNNTQAFGKLAQESFDLKNWSDPVYSEPVYLKEFFSY
ncbi:MAG TPA: tRNA (adenosine(37)-N6)-threonylcarbamoyltransferase complex dimerization subunit type 1 TsaB [Puia sp.]